MPIMTRMRDNMPLILFLLLIAFLLMIVFEWGMDYLGISSGRSDVLGSVNGKKITYQEYNEVVRSVTDQQKAQSGREPDETELQRLREQAWQSIVTQRLVDEEIARLGIIVTDDEIREWVYGPNPPEDLRRFFVDSTGQFMSDTFQDFLRDPNKYIQDPRGENPNYGTRWLADYEKNLRNRRLQEKLQTVLSATVRVGEGEILQRFEEQSVQYSVDYAAFDANAMVKDDDVTVDDADIRAYYDKNLEQYKVVPSRLLKYVVFAETPSAADSAAALADIEDAAAKAKSGADFLELATTYNEKPDSGVVFRRGELSPPTDEAVFAASVGEVVGPVRDNEGYRLLKVLSEKRGDKEFIRARHILFSLTGDSNAVKKRMQDVLKEAKAGKDFGDLARQYSNDGTAGQGGDLGWFTRGRMVAPFENAAFRARVGEIVGPVRSPFGYHIIKVEGRDNRERKVATISSKISPSSQTKNDLFDRAKDFAQTCRETDLVKEAGQFSFEVRETEVRKEGGFVPGIGVNEAIPRWAFTASVNDVSEPVTIPTGYAVFSIVQVKDEGVRPFDELKESLRPLALRQKKIARTAQIAADLRAKLSPGDSLGRISALNPAVSVTRTAPFTIVGTVPGIGRDPAFLGAVMGLKVGEVSPPVEGTRGAYLIRLLSKSEPDTAAYSSQRESLLARTLQEKRSRFFSEWLESLKKGADIEDRRALY